MIFAQVEALSVVSLTLGGVPEGGGGGGVPEGGGPGGPLVGETLGVVCLEDGCVEDG